MQLTQRRREPELRTVPDVAEVTAALALLGRDATVVAGGTEVLLRLRRAQIAPSTLLYIGRLPELRQIIGDDGLSIGACVTHRELIADPRTPAVVRTAALRIGYSQTQETGTVGGNLANAAPADLGTPLLVHGAQVTLTSTAGTRSLPLDEFLLGHRRTAATEHELLTAVTVPPAPAGAVTGYRKVGRRGDMDAPIVTVGVLLVQDPASGALTDARVVVGAYAERPYRATATEQALLADPAAIRDAAALAGADQDALEDVRASAFYRRQLLPRVVADVLTAVTAKGAEQ